MIPMNAGDILTAVYGDIVSSGIQCADPVITCMALYLKFE